MYIHFAFSTIKNDFDAQLQEVTSKILDSKRLKISRNPEFIPIWNNRNGLLLNPEKFILQGSNIQIEVNQSNLLCPVEKLAYLPIDVPMICFIKLNNLSELVNHPHIDFYGKFGLIFSDAFLQSKKITPVIYYSEESILMDQLVFEFNDKTNRNIITPKENNCYQKKIASFRKPAILTKSFYDDASRMVCVENGKLSTWIYDRYPIGYDFRNEKENRIEFNEKDEFMGFEEDDLFAIICPNVYIKNQLINYFTSKWLKPPELYVLNAK